MKFINKYRSKNYNKREKTVCIEYIIIHYTAIENHLDAIDYLCDRRNKVSSHFLINKEGLIYNLVDINNRAWHAGKSNWKGHFDMNSRSIGIELDYLGRDLETEKYSFKQIFSLKKLLKFLFKKFDINYNNILGHSDIAPYRKIDPGKNFPWKKLCKENLSYIPKKLNYSQKKKLNIYMNSYNSKKNIRFRILYMIEKIGYDTSLARKNLRYYSKLISCYQMHFRQKKISGIIDDETYDLICSHFYSCIDLN